MKKILFITLCCILLHSTAFAEDVMDKDIIVPAPANDYLYVIDAGAADGRATIQNVLESGESIIEGVVDLQDLQGAVTDGQVPNDITITNAVYTTDFPLNQNTTGSAASCTGNAATVTNGVYTTDFPLNQSTTGLAATATASADNPTDCVVGSYARGVDANWDAENCVDASIEIDSIVATGLATQDACSEITGCVENAITSAGNSATATALAANGDNCTAGSYPLGVDASGAVESCTDASTEIDSIVATHLTVVADTDTIGHLNDTDWDTFNNKASTTSPTFATSITGSYLTASEIVVTDASKNIVSAAVATYPSLTELSYVKGLTSAVQTQLNVAASTSVAGKVELTIASEVDTGTSTTLAVTPDALQGSKRNVRWLVFNLVEAGTSVAADTNIAGDFVSPIAGTILQSDSSPYYLYATNSTAGTTGTMVVDISLGGTSIMTTNKLDFDTTEKTTTTASTPPDLTDTTIAVGDILTIDIDSIHTTAAKGLTVYMAVRED